MKKTMIKINGQAFGRSEYKYFQREGEKQKKEFFIDFIPKSITQILNQHYLSDFEYEFSFYKETIESLKNFKVNIRTSKKIKEASISNIIYIYVQNVEIGSIKNYHKRIIYLFIIVLIACLRGHSQTFIYFQF